MQDPDTLADQLSSLHAEALRVGDSPLRADRLADRLGGFLRALADAELPEDNRLRMQAAIADAERVLRRDDDGREAARHLQTALRLTERRSTRPSPFPDD